MRGTLYRFIFFLGLLTAIFQPSYAASIHWTTSLRSAVAVAKKSNKLIMIDLYTDSCVYCKKLDIETYPDSHVVKAASNVVPVRLNADYEGRSLAMKFGVHAFPTILFLDAEGNLENQMIGFLPPTMFAHNVQQIVDVHNEIPRILTRYRSNPNDIETAFKALIIYTRKAQAEQAASVATQMEKSDPQNKHDKLSAAYINVGKIYASKSNFHSALPYFHKAVHLGKDPADITYAHMLSASCYMQQKQYKAALPELVAASTVPQGPEELKAQASQILTQLRQSGMVR